jgi:hypothetical protein
MRLDMLLLHEEDLLNFLDDLQKLGKSHVSVRDCMLARFDRGGSPQSNTPRLRSECSIDLVVVREGRP